MFDPKFTITPQILNALNRIEVIREKIAGCPIHPKEEYRLKREAILSMVHHSTAIEGNTLNEFEETLRTADREHKNLLNPLHCFFFLLLCWNLIFLIIQMISCESNWLYW